ncbi:MAG: hypothetical protein LBI72_14565 [Flavobacteriaceae bacterium]|jgi:hypothetical protein|nr:hypothetical protein [Flavobacteriaceae bacterium]
MKKIIGVFFILILTISCNQKKSIQEIQIDTKHTIEVPTGLVKTTDLNPQAVIQLKDANKELYLIVVKEPIEEIDNFFKENKQTLGNQFTQDFKGYADLTYLSLLQKAKVKTPAILRATEINGLTTYTVKFDALVSGLDVYYNFAAVKGEEYYYQILVWTLNTKKEQNKDEMERMVSSFKVVK